MAHEWRPTIECPLPRVWLTVNAWDLLSQDTLTTWASTRFALADGRRSVHCAPPATSAVRLAPRDATIPPPCAPKQAGRQVEPPSLFERRRIHAFPWRSRSRRPLALSQKSSSPCFLSSRSFSRTSDKEAAAGGGAARSANGSFRSDCALRGES